MELRLTESMVEYKRYVGSFSAASHQMSVAALVPTMTAQILFDVEGAAGKTLNAATINSRTLN